MALRREEMEPAGGAAASPGLIPPGWSDNPSLWRERIPLAGLALLGICIAGYLALYQWGVFSSVWEPFFGGGSRRVLHSFISRLLPIPDAALGALGYLVEIVLELAGGEDRWRARPWLPLLFGLVACGMAVVSLALVAMQAFVFRAWCTLCLVSAAISIAMPALAWREPLASARLLASRRAEGSHGSR